MSKSHFVQVHVIRPEGSTAARKVTSKAGGKGASQADRAQKTRYRDGRVVTTTGAKVVPVSSAFIAVATVAACYANYDSEVIPYLHAYHDLQKNGHGGMRIEAFITE